MAFITNILPLSRSVPINSFSTTNRSLPSRPRTAPATPRMVLDVVVTGAGGRTGGMVLKLLRDDPAFNATGVVRNLARATESLGSTDDVVEADITKPDTLGSIMAGKDALVVLTSAMPRMSPPANEGGPPSFYFDEGGTPEDVDWIGQRNQVDLAKKAGVKHVVMVGSMGMSDENHPLNRVGNGNILRFKLKSEIYLKESGLPYTIINPAGLTLNPPNERELIVGTNDDMFSMYEQKDCSIPRGDVARVVVAALSNDSAKNKWFDLAARPVGVGQVTTDPSALFELAPVPA